MISVTNLDVGGRDAAGQLSSANNGSPHRCDRGHRRPLEYGFPAQKRRSERWAKQNQSRGTCAGWRYRNADANRGKRIDQSLRRQREYPRDAEPRGGHHDASTTHAVSTSHLEPPDTPTPSAGGRGSADAVLRKSGPEWGTCSGPRASGPRQSPGAPACPIALIELGHQNSVRRLRMPIIVDQN